MNEELINIPIFPLNGALLLPNSNFPLNIFENRYLSMVDYSLSKDKIIGMIQFKTNDDDELYKIGCYGKITSFKETDDNRYLINLMGIGKFEIIEEIKTQEKFRICKVRKTNMEEYYVFNKKIFDRKLLINRIKDFFSNKGIKIQLSALNEIDDEQLINAVCMICPFNVNEKQLLLESKNIDDLSNNLLSLLQFYNNSSNFAEKMN